MGLETLALIGTGVSALFSAGGAIMKASADKKQAQYQAAVAENNKIIAEREAKYADAVAAQQEVEEVFKVRSVLGEVEAEQAASGLSVSTGSNAMVRSSLRQLGRRSIKNVRDAARREPHALRLQAQGFGNEAKAFDHSARGALLAGGLGAAGSILGGAANIGSTFLDMRQSGVPFDDLELT